MITYRTNGIFNITILQWDAHNDNDLYVCMRTAFIFLFYMYIWYYITLLLCTMLLSYFVRNDEIKDVQSMYIYESAHWKLVDNQRLSLRLLRLFGIEDRQRH